MWKFCRKAPVSTQLRTAQNDAETVLFLPKLCANYAFPPKLCENYAFPLETMRKLCLSSQNYVETVPFHKIFTPGGLLKFHAVEEQRRNLNDPHQSASLF